MSPTAPLGVLALSPVACAAVVWRAAGVLRVTIVVKATFALTPDQDASLVEPTPLEREDRYQEQDRSHSLRRGNDLAPYLPGAGVVLIGHAYAPSGSPVTGLSARLAIYREAPILDKTVHVYGDASPGGGAPSPFLKMPLVYERAYGGPSVPSNPVGVDLAGTHRPNLVHPTNPHRPACFGPIASHWPARRRLFSGLEARLRGDEILELPAELDFRAFNAAPVDQQLPALSGGEWIVLDNMRAGAARVKTRLPSARAQARWHLAAPDGGRASAEQELELVADTLAIDTDLQTASLVWRGSFALDRPELLAQVRACAGLELPGAPLAWPDPATLGRAATGRAAPDLLAHTATAVMSPFTRPALPFDDQDATLEASPSPLRARSPAPTLEIDARIAAGEMPDDPLNRTGPTVLAKIATPALPFNASGAPRFAPAPAPPPSASTSVSVRMPPMRDETAMISLSELVRAEHAPFALATPGKRAADDGVPLPGAPWSPVCAMRVEVPEEHTLVHRRPAPEPPPRMAPPALVAPPAVAAPPVAAPPREEAPPVVTVVLDTEGRGRAQAKLADGRDFDGDDLAGVDLSELDFTSRSLRGCKLCGARLRGAILKGARLAGAQLQDADLTGARLDDADLGGADLSRAVLTGARLDGARLGEAVLEDAKLGGASLVKANLDGAKLSRAQGEGASFEGASLRRADLRQARFPRASFNGAVMREAQADQADFTAARFIRADLSTASFRKAGLASAVLAHAMLDGTDLRNADLERANVHATARRTAKMAGANLKDLDEKAPDAGG